MHRGLQQGVDPFAADVLKMPGTERKADSYGMTNKMRLFVIPQGSASSFYSSG